MKQFITSLNQKFTVATIAGFLISSLVFLALFLAFYQSELQDERVQATNNVNLLLQASLENAMLKRDLSGLKTIISRLGQQANIKTVMIVNPLGEIRFSSNPELIGSTFNKKPLKLQHFSSDFINNEQGVEVLRSVNPVPNKPPCQECHGAINRQEINGILIIDFDASSIRHKVRNTTLILMSAGALIVIINLLGGWWFIQRFILRSVGVLSSASHALAEGNLDTRVQLNGDDELCRLGKTFNLMASSLQSTVRSLEEEQAFLQAIVDAIPDGLRIIDTEYNMILVNQAFREQTGCPDKLWAGVKCYAATQGRDSPCPAELMNCSLEEVLKSGQPYKVIRRHKLCNGKTLDVEVYAAPMKIIRQGKEKFLMVESIRNLKKEVRFTHEQRLSELGRLAANVAHEIYNPLSSMKLAVNSLKHSIDSGKQAYSNKDRRSPDISAYLDIVTQSMEQCIQITERLLRLSAAPLGQQELVDICKAIEDVLSLVKWDAEQANIKIITRFPEQPLRVFASESELRMLILNLVQNAFHAMHSGGELAIRGFVEKEQVVIHFKDTGAGISKEHLHKIFMPFFSRRADNVHGTGLGLPISQAIAQSIHGSLEAHSELGKGSCFILKIPEASIKRLEK